MERIPPIENPNSLWLKVAYWVSKRQFGKPLSALKIIYARSIPILRTTLKVISTERKLSLPTATKVLIRYYTSHLNDCAFCGNMAEYGARRESVELKEWQEYVHFRTSDKFTAQEKALLAYLEEVNTTRTATDATFAMLKHYYTDTEIVEITWLNASENYFNFMAKPLGLTSDNLNAIPPV